MVEELEFLKSGKKSATDVHKLIENMVRPNAFPDVCQCCLSMNEENLRLVRSPANILKLLLGRELLSTEIWLCYLCSHTLRKISHFRYLCFRAQAVLKKYSTVLDSEAARNYFQRDKEAFSEGRDPEPSMSNTLCMSIMVEGANSAIHIDSYNRNGKPPKNYTENIATYHEIILEEGIKLEPDDRDYFENAVQCENDSENHNFIKLESEHSYSMMPLCVIESTTGNCIEKKINDSNSDIPYQSACSEPTGEPTDEGSTGNLNKKNQDVKKKPFNFFLPKSITDEVDKAYANPLSLQEQIKEREDRAQDLSFLGASFKCEPCAVTFQSRAALIAHSKKHLESQGHVVCPVCSLRFPNYHQLNDHSESHSIRFVCHICEERSSSKFTFTKHLMEHLDGFVCIKCGEAFTDRRTLKEHTTKEHPPKKYECETCGRIFLTSFSHQAHMKRHSGQPSHSCSICFKEFYDVKSLNLHLDTHKRKNPHEFYCVECDRHFKARKYLMCHLLQASPHRDPSILKHKCIQCPKVFHTATLLSQHMANKHDKEPRYVCEDCGASFSTRNRMVHHLKHIHQGYKHPKKFPCTICPKSFTSKTHLFHHIGTHTGELRLKCPHCPEYLATKYTLKSHIENLHNNDVRRPEKFTCFLCEEPFVREDLLMDHIREHTGEKSS